jgi:hypothetical protein
VVKVLYRFALYGTLASSSANVLGCSHHGFLLRSVLTARPHDSVNGNVDTRSRVKMTLMKHLFMT